MPRLRLLVCLALVILAVPALHADVTLPNVIGDNMVIQRDLPIKIWGWAAPNEKITVALDKTTQPATADNDGNWKVTLPKMKAGGPYEMTIKGTNTITLKNIMVGEVWLCSGQSNMRMCVANAANGPKELAAANHPNIRLFFVKDAKQKTPASDITGHWSECSPKTLKYFSAAAYYFARETRKQLGDDIAIGLIDAAVGATRIELWTTPDSVKDIPELKGKPQKDLAQHYNGMIAPLIPFGIRGVLWYQGEANVTDGTLYTARFNALVTGWRKAWGQPDLPFGFVQIAPYGGYPKDSLPSLWQAQTACLDIPNTGMAVTNDIVASVKNIHPPNKQEVGRRLALWALAKVYDKKDIVYSGPIYKSMEIKDGKIILTFDHIGTGLAARDNKPLTHFTIAGDDKKFVSATATTDGNTVIVASDKVSNPVAVRFAWSNTAQPNLKNKEGLPASSFRTDKW